MFVPLRQAPVLTPSSVHGLCFSLNSPVVHTDGLPLGPVRAAIVLHASEERERSLCVALRSLDSDATVVFGYDGELLPQADPSRSIALALSFGEGLGFLFDEDLIAGGAGDRGPALARWREFVPPGERQSPVGASDELLLDVEVPDSRPKPEVPADKGRFGAVQRSLSKFRRSPGAEASAATSNQLEDLDARCARRDESNDHASGVIGRLLACF